MKIYSKNLLSGHVRQVLIKEFVSLLNNPLYGFADRNIYRNKEQSLEFLKKHKIIKTPNNCFAINIKLIEETYFLDITNSNQL
ncbi:hypothetical protein [uncultured Mediterranean phage uvDeep-CGR2-KM21-C345]|nr:hypothetical protein [uncultured Mediterranean phage uvDeep-CGR2-KM21-C345]